ncbi:hypothetical protein T440DRAFT_520248 [Plenodomus tracheiphilus IPT5]|uniref:Uncharacterized protein n=1 Tax=Plenodomus tracheiphilus IPT5 TaxID=1408161 RepID=A0A6A7AZ04_9PLEO|nr:hypothetical protein T440DRAFT_520248 [Plenodomus tracheiphilus IPT5]
MSSSYQAALTTATAPSVSTLWQDERANVAPVKDSHIPSLKTWLAAQDFPIASQSSSWLSVKSHWMNFLAATSIRPIADWAPNRKMIWWGRGPESDAAAKQRFKDDRRKRMSIQGAVWSLFDTKDALVEHWPLDHAS